MPEIQPKVFISYSWTNQQHMDRVREWAEHLMADGIQVVMDIFDLKEGDDKYAYMERMVADESVTHVLMFCDSRYAEKADKQKDSSGVGTESQIISSELYSQTKQSKFIPIFCEFKDDGNPCVPVFLKSRFGIDFSTFEKVNENWEKLVRLLYDKPLHVKPVLGKPPAYITNSVPSPLSPIVGKFETLKSALLSEKKGISLYRDDFFNACFDEADRLRVRQALDLDTLSSLVLETCHKLKPVRNALIDWALLEGKFVREQDFSETIDNVLEKLRELKARPTELSSWQDEWSMAHGIFAYETFLYLVAAFLKLKLYSVLHDVFNAHYLCPVSERNSPTHFETFRCLWVPASDFLQTCLKPRPGHRFVNTVAEIMHRQADRSDISFLDLIGAESLIMLMFFVTPAMDYEHWSPHTFVYRSYNSITDLFLRAERHKYFKNLATITGIESADKLRTTVKPKVEEYLTHWRGSSTRSIGNLWHMWNMDNLDSIT